ncbi:sigma-54 dependent transcriptional regulator [Paraburkholderia sp. J12]|uniref:sigma-54-dependent transcriptional regulator n=1 Tax=Paraburkholderia sp. J12 TaxID=2805432 RepID=UPI002ABD2972|nr:sigma-54 dependent transcriptional regulator [Paraburkholderia sp. J12]
MPHALIVEDDPNSLSGLSAILAADGFSVDTAATLAEARGALARFIPDVVLVDLNLPDGSGLELLPHLPAQPGGALPVIVMTGNATVESAIEGLRHGIWDYLLKPVNIPRLRSLLARIPRPYELTEEVRVLRSLLRQIGRFGPMLGRSSSIQRVYDTLEQLAPTEAAILVHGEAGTGKEVAARTLHQLSRRRKGPFVVYDARAACAEAAEGRPLESVLFGHERGAFNGAEQREAGLVAEANGGTLFIDELTDLLPAQQAALLRALDSQTFMRVGGNNEVGTDFRLIAATRTVPRDAVAQGVLNEELWLRLDAAALLLPPLREREEDAALLATAWVDELNLDAQTRGTAGTRLIAPAFIRECLAYDWPGNVRELQERVRRAWEASGDVLETLQAEESSGAPTREMNGGRVQVTVGTPLADVEEMLIRATLDAVGGTRHRAASLLGISPKTLYNKLQRMRLN